MDTLLGFGESGDYVSIPVYQINEAKWKDVGQHVSTISKINNSEKFIGAVVVKDFNSYCWIITCSKQGMIKRSMLPLWYMMRNSRGSTAMKLDDGFASKFTEKISIPIFTSDELVTFAKIYAKDNGYGIDEMGILALYNRIGNVQRQDQATTLTEVKDILDEAIENSKKNSIRKAFGNVFSKRTSGHPPASILNRHTPSA